MAEIMDPFADDYEFLARATPPGRFDPFSGDAAVDRMDEYLRAIGALPPRPPTDAVHAATAVTPPLWCAVDYDAKPLVSFGPYATVFDALVQQQFGAAAPLAPAPDNDDDMDYLDATPGGQTTGPAGAAILVQRACDFSGQYNTASTLALMPSHVPEQEQRISRRDVEERTE